MNERLQAETECLVLRSRLINEPMTWRRFEQNHSHLIQINAMTVIFAYQETRAMTVYLEDKAGKRSIIA